MRWIVPPDGLSGDCLICLVLGRKLACAALIEAPTYLLRGITSGLSTGLYPRQATCLSGRRTCSVRVLSTAVIVRGGPPLVFSLTDADEGIFSGGIFGVAGLRIGWRAGGDCERWVRGLLQRARGHFWTHESQFYGKNAQIVPGANTPTRATFCPSQRRSGTGCGLPWSTPSDRVTSASFTAPLPVLSEGTERDRMPDRISGGSKQPLGGLSEAAGALSRPVSWFTASGWAKFPGL